MLYDIIQSAAVSRGLRLSTVGLYRDALPHRRRNYNLTRSLNISRTDGRTMLHLKSASARLTITSNRYFSDSSVSLRI